MSEKLTAAIQQLADEEIQSLRDEITRLRLTDEELDSIDLAIQQLPYGAARVKVVLYEIMKRYGFQRNRSGKGNNERRSGTD